MIIAAIGALVILAILVNARRSRTHYVRDVTLPTSGRRKQKRS
jgi:hypothetical protein